jgi:hypothetical protein
MGDRDERRHHVNILQFFITQIVLHEVANRTLRAIQEEGERYIQIINEIEEPLYVC